MATNEEKIEALELAVFYLSWMMEKLPKLLYQFIMGKACIAFVERSIKTLNSMTEEIKHKNATSNQDRIEALKNAAEALWGKMEAYGRTAKDLEDRSTLFSMIEELQDEELRK